MHAKLRVLGSDEPSEEVQSLCAWLTKEREFRGRVDLDAVPVRPGEMGALADVLTVAVASGGALTVLANSVSVWLQQRHSALSVEVTSPDGAHTTITAEGRVADAMAKIFGTHHQPH
jgi:hypothetical protein